MSFEQVYYTSCTQGLRGGNGFQVNAASAGLDAVLLAQVERLGGYAPPPTAPMRPTPQELEAFPLTLIHERLPDGNVVVGQARYVGVDYTGRYGNYFTHSLLTRKPEVDLKDLLPIELWRSPSWVTVASPNTTIDRLENVIPGTAVGPEQVQEFLAREGRFERLPAFLTAVEQALAGKRRVILVDEGDGVALWIAAASFALPRHLALGFTFTTYSKNPYQTETLLVGTTVDSDFGFAPHEIEHQFAVFDFVCGRFTPNAAVSPFAAAIASAYAGDRYEQVAGGFLRFVERVAPELPLADLGIAFAAHMFLAGESSSETDPRAIASFCARHVGRLNGQQLGRAFDAVSGAGFDKPSLAATAELYRAAVRAGGGQSQVIDRAFVTWLVDRVAMEAPPAALAELAGASLGPTAIQAGVSVRSTWVKHLAQAADPATVCALLELGDSLDFLRDGDEQLPRIAERMLAPHLAHPSVRSVLKRLVAGPVGSDVMEGLARWLVGQVADDAAFAPLAEFREDREFMDRLDQAARRRGSVPLQMRVVALTMQGDPARRVRAYADCLECLGAERGKPAAAHLDFALELLWKGVPLSIEEAFEVAKLVEGRELKGTRVRTELVDALVRELDLGRPDVACESLADMLVPLRSRRAAEVRKALRWAGKLRSREGADPRSLALALEEGRAMKGPAGPKLVELVVARLSQIEDSKEHAAAYSRCDAVAGAEVRKPYAIALRSRLVGAKPESVSRLVSLIHAWEALPAQTGQRLLDDVLPGATEDWPPRALDAVEEKLEARPDTLDRFRRWREKHRPARGFLSRLKAWRA
jgi:hypothetical protein